MPTRSRFVDPDSALSWVVGGLLLLVQLGAWVLATPIFAGPDEPHHTFWAGAVVDGDLSGREVADDPDRREVLVAPSIVALGYPCFAFEPTQPASCEVRGDPGGRPVSVGTKAARYPPAYYALVGAPLSADAGAASVYGARFLTALLAVVLVIWALWSVRQEWDPYLAVGVSIAMTPMVLSTLSIINPSSLEISANLALWVAGGGAVLACDRGTRARAAVVGVAGAALALSRPLSTVWLGLTAVTLLVLAGSDRFRSLFARRHARAWTGVIALGCAVALAWLWWSGFLTTATSGTGDPVAFGAAVRDSFLTADDDIAQLFGRFGWLDTPLPTGVSMMWLALVGTVLMAALVSARARDAVALIGMIVALVAVPTVLQAAVLGTEGLVWQGRYSLPLAVGIPVVAAWVARQRDGWLGPGVARRWLGWVLVLVCLGQIVAFAGTLRRYVSGIDGPYPGLSGPWQPPLGAWALTVLFAAAAAAFSGWLWMTTGRPSGTSRSAAVAS